MTQRVVASRNSATRRPIIPQNSTSLDVMLVGIGGIAIVICIMAYVLLSRYFSSDRVCKGAHPFVYYEYCLYLLHSSHNVWLVHHEMLSIYREHEGIS
jgi:hypothetical protein